MENRKNIRIKNRYILLILTTMLAICGIFAYFTISANAATGTLVSGYWRSLSGSNTNRFFRANVAWGYIGTENTSTKITIYSTRGSIYSNCKNGISAKGNYTAGIRLYSSKVANEVKNNTNAAFISTNLIKEVGGAKNNLVWAQNKPGQKNIYTTNKTYSYSKTKGKTSTVYLYGYARKPSGVYKGGVKNYVASISVGDYPNRVVSFDANGGSGAPASVKQYWGDALDLSTLTAPTRTGYNFVGWATSSTATSADVITTLAAQSTSIDAITLYAVWEPKQFTVTLDASPGTFSNGSKTKEIVVQYGSNANNTLSDIPVRPGYTLTGFYEDSFIVYDGNGQYSTTNGYWDSTGCYAQDYFFMSSGPDAPIDTSIIYKAKWTVNTYTITFNKNGGSGGTNSVSATYDAALPALSSLPTKEGYVFAGYYDAVTGGKQYYDGDGEGVATWDKTENTTLYARWSVADLPVTYNKNTTDSVTDMPESQIAQTGKSFTFSALVPKRSSKWVFKGWCESADGTGTLYSPGQTIRYGETEGMTLYAVWERNAKRHFKIMFSL